MSDQPNDMDLQQAKRVFFEYVSGLYAKGEPFTELETERSLELLYGICWASAREVLDDHLDNLAALRPALIEAYARASYAPLIWAEFLQRVFPEPPTEAYVEQHTAFIKNVLVPAERQAQIGLVAVSQETNGEDKPE